MVMRAAEIAPGSKLPKQVLLLAAVVLLALGLTTSSAQAATITLGLDFEFSGGTQPSSATTPWVTTTFDDSFGGANTVRLTMSAANLTGGKNGEALAFLFLNFDPTLDSSNQNLVWFADAESWNYKINLAQSGEGKNILATLVLFLQEC